MKKGKEFLEQNIFLIICIWASCGYTWENKLAFDLLAKKRKLKIGHVIKFWLFFKQEYLFGTPGIIKMFLDMILEELSVRISLFIFQIIS